MSIEQDKLVIDNYDLVDHLIKKYYSQYENDEDVFSCANIGLIQASRNYRSSYKSTFRQFARHYILREIDAYINQETSYHNYISSLDDYDLALINYDQKVFEKIIYDILIDMIPTLKMEERCIMELLYCGKLSSNNDINKFLKITRDGMCVPFIYDRAIKKLRYRIRNCKLNGIL